MIVDDELCPDCKQPKPGNTSGSLTQWIFVCHCASLKLPEAETEGDSYRYQVCRKCRKRISTGREGSLTQYIFRSDTCRCQTPDGMDVAIARTINPDFQPAEIETFDDVEGLDLPEASFPTARFKPIREIGRGASGAVYLCIDRLLGTRVAVKTLHYLTADQLLSFQLEARAISKLTHPNIVKILDFGATESGIPYMVLEFIDGTNLETRIDDQGVLDIDDAIQIVLSVCDALSYSHSKEIFHRDLKPSNILLVNDKKLSAKLVDFGVARMKFETLTPNVFQGTALVGTPAYMCPDQMRGEIYDQRSEVYSLGCILFELLTGRQLFIADFAMEIATMHLNAEVPALHEVRNSVNFSDEIQTIVDRCLAKQPGDRFQSMAELKKALEDLSTAEVIPNDLSFVPEEEEIKQRTTGAQDYKEAIQQAIKSQNFERPKQIKPEKPLWRSLLPIVVPVAVVLMILVGTLYSGFIHGTKAPDPKTKKAREKAVSADKPGTFNNTLLETRFQLNQFNGEYWYFNMAAITDKDIDELVTHKDAKRLWLDSGEISPESISKWKRLGVKKVALINIPLTDRHLASLSEISTIRHLRLFDIPGLSDRGLKRIATMHNLEELFVKADNITNDGVSQLLELDKLKILSLDRCVKLDDGSIDTFEKMKHLERLSLSKTAITHGGVHRVTQLKKIKVLSLAGLPCDTSTIKDLAKTRIERLSLRFTPISLDDFRRMATFKYLTMLDVRDIKPIKNIDVKEFKFERQDKNLPQCDVFRDPHTKLEDFGEMVFDTVDVEEMWVN